MGSISQVVKHPNTLLTFGMGLRARNGQNFTIFEAKTMIPLMLQRFSFFLSLGYEHIMWPVAYGRTLICLFIASCTLSNDAVMTSLQLVVYYILCEKKNQYQTWFSNFHFLKVNFTFLN